jgi:hypothetical protein
MAILENFENAWDIDFQIDVQLEPNKAENHSSLANKVFSETVCSDCQYESSPMIDTDNMGRDTSNYTI